MLAVAACAPRLRPPDAFDTAVMPSDLVASSTADQAAEVARGYLDAQTPKLAAPALHAAPDVGTVTLIRAKDSRIVEPRIPRNAAANAGDSLVWIVFASGDFLNLRPYQWSNPGAPFSCGSIIVADGSLEILGVFPHDDREGPACPRD